MLRKLRHQEFKTQGSKAGSLGLKTVAFIYFFIFKSLLLNTQLYSMASLIPQVNVKLLLYYALIKRYMEAIKGLHNGELELVRKIKEGSLKKSALYYSKN